MDRYGGELTVKSERELALEAEVARLIKISRRERLPTDRGGVVRKIHVGQSKVYLKTGEYTDGRLGEIFLQLDECGPVANGMSGRKAFEQALAESGVEGEVRNRLLMIFTDQEKALAVLTEQVTDFSVSVSRLLDAAATAVSIGLQYRIPLAVFCDKYEHTNFEPSDSVGRFGAPRQTSPLDAAFRYLRVRYAPVEKMGAEEATPVAASDPQVEGG